MNNMINLKSGQVLLGIRTLVLASLLFGALPVSAKLKVHSIFSNNMVIQRDKPVKVWGWADPGAKITVTLGADKIDVQAADGDGEWSVTFEPRAASPDAVKLNVVAGNDSVTYDNIVFGDVWVMNGQSNMERDLGKTIECDLEAPQANLPLLRLLTIRSNEQKELQKDIPVEKIGDGWAVCTPETSIGISAIGYAFGSRVQRATGIPIGIIDNARGGASIESLVPERKFAENPLTKRYAEYIKQREADFTIDNWLAGQIKKWEGKVEAEKKKGTPDNKLPKKPTKDDIRTWSIPGKSASDSGSCYNGMFGVFIGYNIKGVLFHQGYNNQIGRNCRPKRYRIMVKQMVEGWREDFGDPRMPVGIIGFCAGGTPQNAYNFEALSRSNGSFIRESQRLGLADVGDPDHTAFLPAYDIQIPGLHPGKKADHGIRAARWALNRVYGMDVHWDTASLVSSEVVGDEIVLHFDKPVFPHNMDAIPVGFAIAGEDGAFYKAYARFRSDKVQGPTASAKDYDTRTIHVWSPLVKEPVGVRYAWSTSPLGNLYVNGKPWAPLTSFRTDTFDLPEDEDPAVGGMPGINYRTVNRENTARNVARLAKEAEMAVDINERLKTLGVESK